MTGEDWVFDSVSENPPTLQFTSGSIPQWMIMLPEGRPNEFVLILGGKEVGRVKIDESGVLRFTGHVDESSSVLFLAFKREVDKYIEERFLE